jgi:predicted N-formylglutamate amidohydrolase
MSEAKFKHECVEHDTHVLLACEAQFPLLLVCDHASNKVPAALENLGMSSAALNGHIGWDIGAGDVARTMGEALQVPVVMASNSRLVVDCNRRLDDPTAFPTLSDGVPVPGNKNLSALARERRANQFYWPYHHAIRDQLQAMETLAAAPAVVSVHSFTPSMAGVTRPWHVGVLWDKDSRMASVFMQQLRKHADVVVGDNEPYSGRHPADFTLDHHAEAEGLPHLGIEVRQDLINDAEGVATWAALLVAALRPVLAGTNLYTHRAGSV